MILLTFIFPIRILSSYFRSNSVFFESDDNVIGSETKLGSSISRD